MSVVVPIKDSVMPFWLSLQKALIEATSFPCDGRDEWVSDNAEDRAYAAGHCTGCSAIAECGTYAAAAKERSNVWAGVDRTPNSGRRSGSLPLFTTDTEGRTA
ncbi:hypothetical protein SAMN04515671_0090 [Nakamurella panacisegetis]|uniref:4Fe-4S Wbl-type domain-containing protein n=1 Tax=Nakamurella panacisegetis TaxID=1090615 RepID=A0A1H0HIR6_9ACTN|nr:hypothetical protein SAMN04515671_0090 [Nakamurella panacisegetis]